MTISFSFTRPLATVTGTETATYTTTLTEDGTNKYYVVDFVATIGSNSKLVRKLIITPTFTSTSLTFTVSEYLYAGNAANYVSATSPATTAAIGGGASNTYTLSAQDMDAFHTAAGDARS